MYKVLAQDYQRSAWKQRDQNNKTIIIYHQTATNLQVTKVPIMKITSFLRHQADQQPKVQSIINILGIEDRHRIKNQREVKITYHQLRRLKVYRAAQDQVLR